MDDRLREFFRQLVQHALNSSITAVIWRQPTVVLVAIIAILLGAVLYFRLY